MVGWPKCQTAPPLPLPRESSEDRPWPWWSPEGCGDEATRAWLPQGIFSPSPTMDTRSVPQPGWCTGPSTSPPQPSNSSSTNTLSRANLRLWEPQSPSISQGWQPRELIFDCGQVSGGLTLSPLKSGAKGLLASMARKQSRGQEPQQHRSFLHATFQTTHDARDVITHPRLKLLDAS